MTPLERISEQASMVTLRIDSHWITIQPRNITVQANIDRSKAPFKMLSSEIETQIDVGVTIFILKTLLNTAPTVNEIIEESNGATHRIASVHDLGVRWQCVCETN